MLINLYIYLVPVMYVAVRESLRCDKFIEGSETQQQRNVNFIAVCTNPWSICFILVSQNYSIYMDYQQI